MMEKKILTTVMAILMITTVFTITPNVKASSELDQSNTTGDEEIGICNNDAMVRVVAQSFKPTMELLSKVKVKIKRNQDPSQNINLYIRSDLSGANLASASYAPSEIPEDYSWINFDFSDIAVTPESTYYIVLETSYDSSSGYSWRFKSTNNPYSRGGLWIKRGTDPWTNNGYENADANFKTYGEEEAPTSPPIVTTLPVLDYDDDSALLNGYLDDDGGGVCQIAFKYRQGTSGDFLVTDWKLEIESGEKFTLELFSLNDNTLYQIKAGAKNSLYEGWGEIVEFTTESNQEDPPVAPVADFTANPRSGFMPLIVQFTDDSINNPTHWDWDFGDGTKSSEQNPTHIYENIGEYTVSLYVYNDYAGDGETKTDYITVTEPKPPVADFTASPRSGELPLTVQFTDKSENAVSWHWDFGDAKASNSQHPNHEYQSYPNNACSKKFTVILTVTNQDGDSDLIIKENYIEILDKKPVASFTASPQSGVAPLKVKFVARSKEFPDYFCWDFGDGHVRNSTVPNVYHTYKDVGEYDVTLEVGNAAGSDTEIKTDYITVTDPGVFADAGGPYVGYVDIPISFDGTGSTGIDLEYQWTAQDHDYPYFDVCLNWATCSRKYSNTGTYDVSLTVTDYKGDTDVDETEVTILPHPGKEDYLALILCGGNYADGGPNFKKKADKCYNTFKSLGYKDDQIYYIGYPVYNQDGVDSDISLCPNTFYSLDSIQTRSTANTNLFIFITGHGSDWLNSIQLSEDFLLQIDTLNSHLDSINYKYCTILLDCCYAGKLAKGLSGPNRLVYAVTDDGSSDDTNPFSEAFFDELSQEYSYGVAWMAGDEKATEQWYNPQIDDNEDGVMHGTPDLDTLPFPDGDGTLSLKVWPSDVHKKSKAEETAINNPPETPNKPNGPTTCEAGTEYTYNVVTTDADGDDIKFYISWELLDITKTTFHPSGETVSINHIWQDEGTYKVRVKAKDENGATSPWSEPLIVTVNYPDDDGDEGNLVIKFKKDGKEINSITKGEKFTVVVKRHPSFNLFPNMEILLPVANAKVTFNGETRTNIISTYVFETKDANVGPIPVTAEHKIYGSTSKYITIIEKDSEPNSCFLKDTKIAMADGSLKNIQDIQIGDMVMSFDETAQEWKPGMVTTVFHHTAEEMTDYYLILNKDLCVTPNHPVFLDGSWADAGDLKVGDTLGVGNDKVVITSIEKVYEKVPTFNFEVEKYHNYNVIFTQGETVLVHNKACAKKDSDKHYIDPDPGDLIVGEVEYDPNWKLNSPLWCLLYPNDPDCHCYEENPKRVDHTLLIRKKPLRVTIEYLDTIYKDTEYEFTATITPSLDLSDAHYIWNFGDGTSEEVCGKCNVAHTYSANGPHTLSVDITDSASLERARASVTINVLGIFSFCKTQLFLPKFIDKSGDGECDALLFCDDGDRDNTKKSPSESTSESELFTEDPVMNILQEESSSSSLSSGGDDPKLPTPLDDSAISSEPILESKPNPVDTIPLEPIEEPIIASDSIVESKPNLVEPIEEPIIPSKTVDIAEDIIAPSDEPTSTLSNTPSTITIKPTSSKNLLDSKLI